MMSHSFLAAFNFLFSLVFNGWIMMYLGIDLFYFILLGVYWVYWMYVLMSFLIFGKCSVIISSIFFLSLCLCPLLLGLHFSNVDIVDGVPWVFKSLFTFLHFFFHSVPQTKYFQLTYLHITNFFLPAQIYYWVLLVNYST